jgi:hypothetical protein
MNVSKIWSKLSKTKKRACFLCGKHESSLVQLVPIADPRQTEEAEIVWICRQGHFDATVTNALTGLPVELTGSEQIR